MGIMSEIRSTYSFAKGELKKDIKRSPTLSRAYDKTKKTFKKPKLVKIVKPKRGKSISNEAVLKKLKKSSPKSKYKRVKYKGKTWSGIKKDSFSTTLKGGLY